MSSKNSVMINIYPSPGAYLSYLESLQGNAERVEQTVRDILARVKKEGDAAVRAYSEQFDGIVPDPFLVPVKELDRAVAYLNPAIKDVWIEAGYRLIQLLLPAPTCLIWSPCKEMRSGWNRPCATSWPA